MYVKLFFVIILMLAGLQHAHGPVDARNFSSDVSVRPSVRPSVRTDSTGGGWKSQGNPTGGRRMSPFLVGKSRGAIRKPAFILAENLMIMVAFDIEVFLKA